MERRILLPRESATLRTMRQEETPGKLPMSCIAYLTAGPPSLRRPATYDAGGMTVDREKIRALAWLGASVTKIALALDCTRDSVYRVLEGN